MRSSTKPAPYYAPVYVYPGYVGLGWDHGYWRGEHRWGGRDEHWEHGGHWDRGFHR
jgi:hypothetical protein